MDEEHVIDLRYMYIEYELWALARMLDLIEPAIEDLSKVDEEWAIARLTKNGWDLEEGDIRLHQQEMSDMRDVVLPRFVRGPFLIALWACFESSVQAIAVMKQKEKMVPIKLEELRGDSFLKRAERYYDALLGLRVDENPDRWTRLVDMYRIRCAIAHDNGQLEEVSGKKRNPLKEALRRQNLEVDEVREYVILTERYLRYAFDDVSGCLRGLIARTR